MPSDATGREIYRATFAGVDELSDQIKEAMERQASRVYAASLRRAADAIRSMKFVEHAHDKLIRLAEDEDKAIGVNEEERPEPLGWKPAPHPSICINPDVLEEGESFTWRGATWYLTKRCPEDSLVGSRLPEDARQLALLARALGIRSNPETEHVLPNKDRDSLVDHADAVLESLKEEKAQSVDLEIPQPPHVQIGADTFSFAHDIAHVADHYDLGDHKAGAIVPVCLADLRTLRASLHGGETPHLSISVCKYGLKPGESEKEKADRLFEEYKDAVPLPPSLVPDESMEALAVAIDLVFAEDFTVGPDLGLKLASVQKCHVAYREKHPLGVNPAEDIRAMAGRPIECKLCRAWHQPPACTKEGAKK